MINQWVMQYRTRENAETEWNEWKSLPEQLIFSSYYAPLYFQFRMVRLPDEPRFVFTETF